MDLWNKIESPEIDQVYIWEFTIWQSWYFNPMKKNGLFNKWYQVNFHLEENKTGFLFHTTYKYELHID